ncbi:MAG: hypothetical protein WCF85_11685 [Rhodospirillaceae bacterium]
MAGTTLPKSGANANTNTFVGEKPPANDRSGKASPPPNLPVILALDLGTHTGWALRARDGTITSGTVSFQPGRFEGAGMTFLRFRGWLEVIADLAHGLNMVVFEEVRRHAGTTAAHVYGGFLAHLTAWCEHERVPYQGVPVGTIKRHATGKGNAGKDAVIAAMKAKGHTPIDDNEADALAILYWALAQGGGR